VGNCDTVPFHVTDVEILSSFDLNSKKAPLPFTMLLDNEKIFVYRLTQNNFTTDIISNRGPMIAGLVTGDKIYYFNTATKQEKEIKACGYLYIEPGAVFSFSFKGKENPNMVLFEIK